jgi:glycosyltransferase involved in cell wall biosynthesis
LNFTSTEAANAAELIGRVFHCGQELIVSGGSKPSVAVVVPLYNHARYIEETIRSVLCQTHAVDEIVVIDDGSDDCGFDLALALLKEHPGAQVLRQANAGAHNAINRCIEATKSNYIAILNSDDIFSANRIARCLHLLTVHKSIDLIIGRINVIDHNGDPLMSGPTIDWLGRAAQFLKATRLLTVSLLHENFAATTSNMLFSRQLWIKNKGFQSLRYCHDLDFLVASAYNGHIFFDSETDHISYRVHPGNTIKENPSRIRVEIAAVLVSAIYEHGLNLTGGKFDANSIAALAEMLQTKDLSDLALILFTLYRSCPDRTRFYEIVTSRDTISLLQTVIDSTMPFPSKAAKQKTELASASSVSMPRIFATPAPVASIQVAIEVSAFDKGGLEKVVLDSAILFKDRGIDPLIISAGSVGYLGSIAARNGIEVIRLPTTSRLVFYKTLLSARGVQLTMSHFSRIGYPIFKALGIPNITFIHNVYAMLSGEPLTNFINDHQYVDTYISVSQKATRYAVGRLEVDAERVVTLPNGLIFGEHEASERSAVPASRRELGIGPNDYVLLNVASYNLHKGHYLMAEAMRLILPRRTDIKIVCIGNEIYPPHVRELRAYLIENGLDRHIMMPGYFPDVASYHLMSDAFLLPSFIEGWSVAMNEAMFYGKPMILSDTGGSSEIIEDDDIGIVVPNEYGDVLNLDSTLLDELAYSPRQYKTAPVLAHAMESFANNREFWKEAGAMGRQKVFKYNLSDIVDRYISIVKALVKPENLTR